LLGFAGSVSLTRFFLFLTGYPQIAGGDLHIAHALWGGLLLFIATLLPLLLSNRRVFSASALIGGIGVGLFIDEVGKFITKTNNYFYPAAAPIFYTFFLLSILLFLRYTRPAHQEDHAELSRALEDIQEFLRHPLTLSHREAIEKKLECIAVKLETGAHARLAQQLLSFVQCDDRQIPEVKSYWYHKILNRTSSWFTVGRLRAAIIIGLVGLGLLSMKNPATVLLASRLSETSVIERILSFTSGRHLDIAAAPELANIRMIMEMIVGTLFFL
jgi:hypothetical protein